MGSCSFGPKAQATSFAPSKEPKGLRFLHSDAAAAAAGMLQWPPSSNGVHHKSMAEDYNLTMIRHGQLLSSSPLQPRTIAAQNQHLTKSKRRRRSKTSAAPVKQLLKYPTPVAAPLRSLSQWNPSKDEEPVESQLTIFYGGAVLVYNGVTPNKAQEIMLVANKRTKGGKPSYSVASRTQTLALDPMQIGVFEANAVPPEIEIQNPEVPNISLSLSIGVQGSNQDDMVVVPSTVVYPTAQFTPVDVTAESNSSAAAAVPRAIPQARKMSLARFFEKRKNRLINCKPYGTNIKRLII